MFAKLPVRTYLATAFLLASVSLAWGEPPTDPARLKKKPTDIVASTSEIRALPGQTVSVAFALRDKASGARLRHKKIALAIDDQMIDSALTNRRGEVVFGVETPASGSQEIVAKFGGDETYGRSRETVTITSIDSGVAVAYGGAIRYPNSNVFDGIVRVAVFEVDAAGRPVGALTDQNIIVVVSNITGGNLGFGQGVTGPDGAATLKIRMNLSALGKKARISAYHGFYDTDGTFVRVASDEDKRSL